MAIAPSMRALAQNIASAHGDRTKAVLEIIEEAERVAADAQELITGFQASRREEAAQLREGLAQGVAQRKPGINALLGNARQSVRRFRSQRKEAAGKLRKELARSRSRRESDVGELLKSARDLVTDLGKSRQETGEKLRNDLAKGRADRESGGKEMRSEFHKSRAEVRSDIDEARAAWQEPIRGVKKATVKATPRVVKAKVAKTVPSGEEIPDLEAKLLAAISSNPQGITLTEVAESLGVIPIVFGRAARKLVDEGRVRKENKSYFPIARK